jgi:hypothetical protein
MLEASGGRPFGSADGQGAEARAGAGPLRLDVEPVEITNPDGLQARITAGGVITVTRGTFETPVAHRAECAQLKQIRLPSRQRHRYWWTPDYPTAATTLEHASANTASGPGDTARRSFRASSGTEQRAARAVASQDPPGRRTSSRVIGLDADTLSRWVGRVEPTSEKPPSGGNL